MAVAVAVFIVVMLHFSRVSNLLSMYCAPKVKVGNDPHLIPKWSCRDIIALKIVLV